MEPNSFRAYVEATKAASQRRHDIAHKLGSYAPIDHPAAIALTKHCWAWFEDGDSGWRGHFREASMGVLAMELRRAGWEEDGEEWEDMMDLHFCAFNDWGEDGQQCTGLKARAQEHRAVVHAQVKDEEDQILRTLCAAALAPPSCCPAPMTSQANFFRLYFLWPHTSARAGRATYLVVPKIESARR